MGLVSAEQERLRIVHTEASQGWGGQELRILTEAAGMQRRGHAVTLLCPAEARIGREAGHYDVPVVALPIGRKSVGGVRSMYRWLTAHRVDVVNSHSSTDSWLAALAMLFMRAPPALIRTRHISAPVSTNAATRWLYCRATRHIVTAGASLREELIRRNEFPAGQITSVPTGIDVERFGPGNRVRARATLGLPTGAPIVGIVATLRSWKGHRFLVDAMVPLTNKGAVLLIVGDGPQLQALESQVRLRGLRERVWLVGNQRDVAPWLQAMDIFALPSYANEGVPQAILQAMLCGLPVVTTAVGSITEAVRDEVTGLIVEPRSAGALEGALHRLLDDPALRDRLGREGARFARENFGLEPMIDRMEGIFRRCAGPDE